MAGTVLVPYDLGSVSPTSLATIARANSLDLVFVPAKTAHATAMKPVLASVGTVVKSHGELEKLVATAREVGPVGILTFAESMLDVTARLAADLGLGYNSVDTVRALTSKSEQRARFRQHGLDGPRCIRVSRARELLELTPQLRLPCVVKPDVGSGSRYTAPIATLDELRRFVPEVPDDVALVAEDLLVGAPVDYPWGDYVGVECLVSDGAVTPLFVADKFALAPPFRERGAFTPPLPQRDLSDVVALACAAVRAIGVTHGIAGAEVKLTPAGPVVIEVNGRLGGWVENLARRAMGHSLAEIGVRAALGHASQDREPSVDHEAPGIHYEYELIPPMSARRVRDDVKVRALKAAAPGARVAPKLRPGGVIDWRSGSASSLAVLSGWVATHDELKELVIRLDHEIRAMVI